MASQSAFASGTTSRLHPLLDRNASVLGRCRYTLLLTEQVLQLIGSSHADGRLNGVCLLEMARAAGELATERPVHGLKNLMWGAPLQLGVTPSQLSIAFASEGADVFYQIYADEDELAPLHIGQLILEPDSAAWPAPLDATKALALLQTSDSYWDGDALLARLSPGSVQTNGMPYDPLVLQTLWQFVRSHFGQQMIAVDFPAMATSIRRSAAPGSGALLRIVRSSGPAAGPALTAAVYDADGSPILVLEGICAAPADDLNYLYSQEATAP